MLRRYRRYWAIPIFLLVSLPALLHALGLAGLINKETGTPDFPAPVTTRSLPARIDGYLSRNFGWRQTMITANGAIRHFAFASGNSRVLVGRDGRLFIRDQDAIAQSAGDIIRRDRIVATVEFLATMKRILEGRGTKMYVAIAPNGSTVYGDHLPLTVQDRPTEYDLMMSELSAKAIASVDLRPALLLLRARTLAYYAYDTHWTDAGTISAFNAIAERAGRSDWRFEMPESSAIAQHRGDLARLLGIGGLLSDSVRYAGRAGIDATGEDSAAFFVVEGRGDGPTVMVIGDSFSAENSAIPWLLQKFAGKVVWLHHRACDFDWRRVDEFKPDEVWWLPVERDMVCSQGSRPRGAPAAFWAMRQD